MKPIDTAWDIGMGDSTVVWAFQITEDGIDVIGCYENHGEEASHYVAELNSRGWYGGRDIVPHDIKVREWGTGRTRFETICRLGRRPELCPAHTIEDGINATRLTIPKCRIDQEGCASGLECLRRRIPVSIGCVAGDDAGTAESERANVQRVWRDELPRIFPGVQYWRQIRDDDEGDAVRAEQDWRRNEQRI